MSLWTIQAGQDSALGKPTMTDRTSAPSASTKLPVSAFAAMRGSGRPIVVLTAYDAPSARLADEAGVDVVLVGDSAGTTVLGGGSTVPVTMDEMVVFTRAASRGVKRAFLVADMPFGSYQVSDEDAVLNAVRLVKDGGAEAVKLEGAGTTLSRVAAIIAARIPVMGHVGLTPQSATMLGGYRAQGRTAAAAARLVSDAQALEQAGAFAIVLEAIPAAVAEEITRAVTVPTIGIGAGRGCSGQVLVWHDLLGLSPEPRPRFVKTYANVGDVIAKALSAYVTDVRGGTYPSDAHTYGMMDGEREEFQATLEQAHGAKR
jgi:3-methyl-2-oxobutanoate hydroxymethyltransferase